jgi:hypothetical protein
VSSKGEETMPTQLLDNDGTASMATMIMTSHFAFRRDIACFARALAADIRDAAALGEEWTRFRAALHGHHTVEDTALFPDLRAKYPDIAMAIDQLDAQHREIDPLLERGDEAFANLAAHGGVAREVVDALSGLLAQHLDLEERTITPYLRDAKQFPAPPNDDALAMYADGFAWSTAGLAPSVVEQIYAMLPAPLAARIPLAREAFDARCRRVWGAAHTGSATTSVPGQG